MNNKTKFLKFTIAAILGSGLTGILYAQLSIESQIDNSVITMKQVNVVDSDNKNIITLSGGSDIPLQIQGSTSIGNTKTNRLKGKMSSIIGGKDNQVDGNNNIVGGNANDIIGSNSVIPGGKNNKITSDYGFVAGGENNEVRAKYGFAGGQNAISNAQGTFVWSDAYYGITQFIGSVPNSFVIRANGGVGINTASPRAGYGLTLAGSGYVAGNLKIGDGGLSQPAAKLHVIGNVVSDAYYYKAITADDDDYSIKDSQRDYSTSPVGAIYYNSGNLGLGTTAPTEKLHVVGNTIITNNLTVGNQISVQNINAKLLPDTSSSTTVVVKDGSNNLKVVELSAIEKDPTVKVHGKTDVPTCDILTQKLYRNGTTWSCITDAQRTIINDLTSTEINSALSAKQGYILKGLVDNLASATETDPLSVKLEGTQTINGVKTFSSNVILPRQGLVGVYNAAQVQGIWSLGNNYKIDINNNNFGNQYGIVYAHTNAGTDTNKKPIPGRGHQILFTNNGVRNAAISLSEGNGYFGGNVGIGTTDPKATLDVKGSFKISQGRELNYDGGSLTIKGTAGGRANGFFAKGSDGASLGGFGLYGGTNTLAYYYIGNGYNTPTMVINPNNNYVGIGTTDPKAKLHVNGETDTSLIEHGLLVLGPTNGANISIDQNEIQARNNGSTSTLYIQSEGGNLLLNDTSGNVGIGTKTPSNKLHVNGNIGANGWIGAGCEGSCEGEGGYALMYANGTIVATSSVTAKSFYYSSDITLKKDLKQINNSLDKILALNGYYFTWKSDDTKDIGLIAQEVEKVFPDAVKADDKGLKSVKYGNLVAPIIESIKELYNKYLDQQEEINELEIRIQSLEKLLK